MRTEVALVFGVLLTACASAPMPPDGLILGVHDAVGAPVLRAAQQEGGATWRGARVETPSPVEAQDPMTRLEAMNVDWANVEFSACLARSRSPALGLPTLLAQGNRRAAARSLVLGAGCALGAGQAELADRLLERGALAELDLDPFLRTMTVELQRRAERVRERVGAQPRVELRVAPEPPDATVRIDGLPCERGHCARELLPGPHVVTATSLGYLPRQETLQLAEPTTRSLALDPAPSSTQRVQLSDALRSGASIENTNAMRVASEAYGAPVVLALSESSRGYRLALFDRREEEGGAIVVRLQTDSASSLAAATQQAVREWRGLRAELIDDPWFWLVSLGGAALATTVVSVALTYEPAIVYSIVPE